jgi:hypothetical protein
VDAAPNVDVVGLVDASESTSCPTRYARPLEMSPPIPPIQPGDLDVAGGAACVNEEG